MVDLLSTSRAIPTMILNMLAGHPLPRYDHEQPVDFIPERRKDFPYPYHTCPKSLHIHSAFPGIVIKRRHKEYVDPDTNCDGKYFNRTRARTVTKRALSSRPKQQYEQNSKKDRKSNQL